MTCSANKDLPIKQDFGIFKNLMIKGLQKTIEWLLNSVSKHHSFDGESMKTDHDECFTTILQSVISDEEFKSSLNQMQITLPGYDYKIPKFIYEERQDSSNRRLIE